MAAMAEEEGQQQLQLTDLPDDILIRILSLLPTDEAVRTCLLVLRRGQQNLWKSLTSLEFLEQKKIFLEDFLTPVAYFTDFVDRVMNLRDPSVPLVWFSLQFSYHEIISDRDYEYFIKPWITKALECHVKELTLSANDVDAADEIRNLLHCCIFGCQSLVMLDLEFIIFEVPSSVICLPHLKYLRLGEQVRILDGESIEKVLSSPLLEELIIANCYWCPPSIHVCSPKLQVLKICDYDSEDEYHSAKICIIGDNLRHFSYTGDLLYEYQICAASSTQLNNVEIYVSVCPDDAAPLNCYKILKGLSGTRNLALSDFFLKGLQEVSELLDTIPVLECVTRLGIRVYANSIRFWFCIDSLALMKIYERCPNLEYLNIGKLSLAERSLQLSPIPLCFRNHLKKILIHYYVPGDDKADAAIDVLLNSAFVLEELVIYCQSDVETGFHEDGGKIQEVQDRLNRRPRVSKDCIILVKGEDYIKTSRVSWRKDYVDYYLQSMNES